MKMRCELKSAVQTKEVQTKEESRWPDLLALRNRVRVLGIVAYKVSSGTPSAGGIGSNPIPATNFKSALHDVR